MNNSEKGGYRKRPRKIYEQQMAIEAALEMQLHKREADYFWK
jgi:hypothetical protein